MKKVIRSFQFAIEGIGYAIKTQKNLKIHGFIAIVAILLSLYFQIERWEWIVLLLVFAMVLTSELLNTAIERTIDLITQDYHEYAKCAKDVAAGAVLISAIIAVIIGFLLFFERIVKEF